MLAAAHIREVILQLAESQKEGISPSEAARAIDSENWRKVMDHVRLVIKVMVAEGKLMVKKGKVLRKLH
jgi:predicted Zn-ribbon and HTH transcriptional regulator